MARDVLSTEYGLHREIRADLARAAEPDLLTGIWQLLRRAANRALRMVGLGRGEEATSPGGEPEPVLPGRGQERGQGSDQEREHGPGRESGRVHVPSAEGVQRSWGPVPEGQRAFMSERTQSLHERMTGLEQTLRGLPSVRRADVEDAILKELRRPGNKELLAALIASPDNMPVLAGSFNNATVRESERMAPPGAGDVRPPEQRRSNGEVRPEVTADAARFAAARNRWQRPARSRDSGSPRSFQDPSDRARPDANSLEALRERQLRERESPVPEMRHVEHYDGGAFITGSTERLRQTPTPTATPTPTPAESPSPEELRAAAAQLNPLSTADLADRPNWPLRPTLVSAPLDHGDPAADHEPVSPLLDQIGLAVVNDPAVARGSAPSPRSTDTPSHSRPASHVQQNGNSNGGSPVRVGRR
ncbi:hypothetical protein [Streptomyces sp. NPDC126522]|uniref:hypothetical protein n=1 Tax=Streptomyces sp. NPDC126522 TaxID=3155211 RepID=UPI00332BF73E